MKKMPHVLAIMPGLFPSTIIGVVKPLLELEKQKKIKFKLTISRLCRKSFILKADCIVFCRNCEVRDLELLILAKKNGKKIIYEIDDNFFEIEIKNPLGKYHRYPGRLFVLKKFFELSDVVRVYSNNMLKLVSKYNTNVELINSYFDFKLIDNNNKVKNEKIKIAYATSRGKEDDLQRIFDMAMIKILDKYHGKIELYTWGEKPKTLQKRSDVIVLPFERDYNKFIRQFYKSNFDIGLAPLKNDIFHNSKTNNKFREYGACLVAGIYSNVDVYSSCIKNKTTGLLVGNSKNEWFNAIEELILNDKLRGEIQKNARECIKKNYSLQNSVNSWNNDIDQVLKCKNVSINSLNHKKLKLLIVTEKSNQHVLRKRLDSLIETCHFLGYKFEIIYEPEIAYRYKNKFNCIIYVISGDIKESLIIEKELDIPIVIDAIKPNDTFLKTVNGRNFIIVSNEKVLCNNRFYLIKDMHYHDTVNIMNFEMEDAFENIYGMRIFEYLINNNSIDDVLKKINQIPEFLQRSRDLFYSIDSPIVVWAEILTSIYSKKKLKVEFEDKLPTKIIIFKNKIVYKYLNANKFIKKTYETLVMIFKINILKKY